MRRILSIFIASHWLNASHERARIELCTTESANFFPIAA